MKFSMFWQTTTSQSTESGLCCKHGTDSGFLHGHLQRLCGTFFILNISRSLFSTYSACFIHKYENYREIVLKEFTIVKKQKKKKAHHNEYPSKKVSFETALLGLSEFKKDQ